MGLFSICYWIGWLFGRLFLYGVLSLIMSLSHIAKIHIILIKQTIFSKKIKKKGDQVSGLLCTRLLN